MILVGDNDLSIIKTYRLNSIYHKHPWMLQYVLRMGSFFLTNNLNVKIFSLV